MWRLRYRRWFEATRALPFADTILMVDDGSPVLPGWTDLSIVSDDVALSAGVAERSALLYHFRERLGRKTLLNFPGWYRSFGTGIRFGVEHGFDKIVHLESDAYLLSKRMVDRVASLDDGWTSFWCPKYQFPELAIQVIAGDALQLALDFVEQPYDHLVERVHEYHVPLTRIEKEFCGDRLGETADDVPIDDDYVCQVPSQRERGYYWWLTGQPSKPGAVPSPTARRVLAVDFSLGGGSADYVGVGWHGAEEGFRWMDALVSEVRLSDLPVDTALSLRIDLHPLLVEGKIAVQRLSLSINATPLEDYEINDNGVVGVTIPRGTILADAPNILRLLHPDAAAPASFGASSDTRLLSLAVRSIEVVAVNQADPIDSESCAVEPLAIAVAEG